MMTAKDRLRSLHRLYRQQQKLKRKVKSEEDLLEMNLRYLTLMHELIGEIDRIEDTMQAEILYRHYIRFVPLKEICEVIDRDYYHTCRLHRKALQEYEQMLCGESLSYDAQKPR